MKTTHCIPAVVVLLTGLLASCAAPPSQVKKVPVSLASSSDKSLDGRLLVEVNSYRSSKGRPPLVRNAGLDRMAREHSEFMRRNRGTFSVHGRNVSHSGFENRCITAKAAMNMISLSENVAAAKTTSMPAFVKMWAGSKAHEYNMGAGWHETGVGVVVDDDGTVFATQIFGAKGMSGLAFRDRLH